MIIEGYLCWEEVEEAHRQGLFSQTMIQGPVWRIVGCRGEVPFYIHLYVTNTISTFY